MRRRLALLVAATTSVVLLAFLLPLAVLVDRAAGSNAISEASARAQVVASAVTSGATAAEIDAVTAQLRATGLQVRVVPTTRHRVLRTTVTRNSDGDAVVRQPVVTDRGLFTVRTVVPKAQLRSGVTRAWVVLGGLGVVLVSLSLLVADRLARGDLGARVQPDGPTEVARVGEALNLLAGRIGDLLASERESVADLSHRLRTPITALQLGVEALPAGPERDSLLGSVADLTRQVDRLIDEARRPVREGVEARCDAREVTAERVAFWQALAEDQGRVVTLRLPPGEVWVRASEVDLAAALDALLGNVIAHTPEGADFTVELCTTAAGGELVVHDEGPGFDGDDVVRRGHSRAGSTGLGLDIARRTAVASGGDLEVGRSPTGGGLVRLRLGAPAG